MLSAGKVDPTKDASSTIQYDTPLTMTPEKACEDGVVITPVDGITIKQNIEQCTSQYTALKTQYNAIMDSKKNKDKSKAVSNWFKKDPDKNKEYLLAFFLTKQAAIASGQQPVVAKTEKKSDNPEIQIILDLAKILTSQLPPDDEPLLNKALDSLVGYAGKLSEEEKSDFQRTLKEALEILKKYEQDDNIVKKLIQIFEAMVLGPYQRESKVLIMKTLAAFYNEDDRTDKQREIVIGIFNKVLESPQPDAFFAGLAGAKILNDTEHQMLRKYISKFNQYAVDSNSNIGKDTDIQTSYLDAIEIYAELEPEHMRDLVKENNAIERGLIHEIADLWFDNKSVEILWDAMMTISEIKKSSSPSSETCKASSLYDEVRKVFLDHYECEVVEKRSETARVVVGFMGETISSLHMDLLETIIAGIKGDVSKEIENQTVRAAFLSALGSKDTGDTNEGALLTCYAELMDHDDIRGAAIRQFGAAKLDNVLIKHLVDAENTFLRNFAHSFFTDGRPIDQSGVSPLVAFGIPHYKDGDIQKVCKPFETIQASAENKPIQAQCADTKDILFKAIDIRSTKAELSVGATATSFKDINGAAYDHTAYGVKADLDITTPAWGKAPLGKSEDVYGRTLVGGTLVYAPKLLMVSFEAGPKLEYLGDKVYIVGEFPFAISYVEHQSKENQLEGVPVDSEGNIFEPEVKFKGGQLGFNPTLMVGKSFPTGHGHSVGVYLKLDFSVAVGFAKVSDDPWGWMVVLNERNINDDPATFELKQTRHNKNSFYVNTAVSGALGVSFF